VRSLILVAVIMVTAPAGILEARGVYGATPSSNFTLYVLDPELLAGWNTPLRDYEKKFIPAKYHALPILGGWYGEGFVPNREVLLGSGIKKAFYLPMRTTDSRSITETLTKLGMEIITFSGYGMSDLAPCFRNMGQVFNRKERGEALAAYAETTLAQVRSAMGNLPPEKRVRVYVALEADGLASVCRSSERAEVFEMAGAVSVHKCPPGAEESFLRVTFEQLMTYDPEVILVYHPNIMRIIPSHSRWRQLSAVRQGRVYFIPRGPFSWLERPATYMRLIGVQWLAGILHPDLYPVDIKAKSKEFMKLFFNLDLTEKQIGELFEPYGTF